MSNNAQDLEHENLNDGVQKEVSTSQDTSSRNPIVTPDLNVGTKTEEQPKVQAKSKASSSSFGSFWGKLYNQGTSVLQNYEKQFDEARRDLSKYAETSKWSEYAQKATKDFTTYAGQATQDLERFKETAMQDIGKLTESARDLAKYEMERLAEWERKQEERARQASSSSQGQGDDFIVMADGTIVPIEGKKSTQQQQLTQVPEPSTSTDKGFDSQATPTQAHFKELSTPVKETSRPIKNMQASTDQEESQDYSQDKLLQEEANIQLHREPQGKSEQDHDNLQRSQYHSQENTQAQSEPVDSTDDHLIIGGLDLSQPPPILESLRKEWSQLRSSEPLQKRFSELNLPDINLRDLNLADLNLNEQSSAIAQKICKQGGSWLTELGDEVNKLASQVVTVQSPRGDVSLYDNSRVLNRHEALLHQLRKDRTKILRDPTFFNENEGDKALAEEYAAFLASIEAQGGFLSTSWQAAIDKELDNARSAGTSSLDIMYNELVPAEIPDDVFWSRFLFHVDKINKEEALRRELLSKAEDEDNLSEDDFAWDDDDDDESIANKGDTASSQAMGDTLTRTPLSSKISSVQSPVSISTSNQVTPRRPVVPEEQAVSVNSTHQQQESQPTKLDDADSSDSDWY